MRRNRTKSQALFTAKSGNRLFTNRIRWWSRGHSHAWVLISSTSSKQLTLFDRLRRPKMPTRPYGESVNVCVPYMYPSVCAWECECVCVCNDVIPLVGKAAAGVMACMCVSWIRRQVDTLSEIPGMESAGPRENHTVRVLLTQKTTSLTTITGWQQPAQHNAHRQETVESGGQK